jgi:cystathionine beta-lyase
VKFDFDREIPRAGTASVKYDGAKDYFGGAEAIPMWVADMDFAVPEAVTRALTERADHPIYGYTLYPDGMYEATALLAEKTPYSIICRLKPSSIILACFLK